MHNHNVLLVGEFSANPAVYTYATSFAESFERLGAQVSRFACRTSPSAEPRFGRVGRVMQDYRINQQLIAAVQKYAPNIIFFLKAENIWQRSVAQIKKMSSARIIWFYPDNPFVMWNGNSNQEMLKVLPFVDTYLIWSEQLIPILQQAGAPQVCYFPFGVDPQLFWRTTVNITPEDSQRYAADCCFVGTWDVERAWWLTQLVECMPHISLAIWGNSWHEFLPADSPLRPFLRGTAVYGVEMIKAFRVAKIVLNFIRPQNATSHNMRTIEAPASKSFLLTERTYEQAELLFTEGTSITCFSTPEELVAKIEYYLKHEPERQQIIERGYQRAHAYGLDLLLDSVIQNHSVQGLLRHDDITQRRL